MTGVVVWSETIVDPLTGEGVTLSAATSEDLDDMVDVYLGADLPEPDQL